MALSTESTGRRLRPEDTEELMRSITSEDHIQHVREQGGADFGFAFGEVARFRVSVFKEKGNFGLVLRQIPTKLLTLEQIGLPRPHHQRAVAQAARLGAGHRPDRFGQDHHPGLDDQHHQ